MMGWLCRVKSRETRLVGTTIFLETQDQPTNQETVEMTSIFAEKTPADSIFM